MEIIVAVLISFVVSLVCGFVLIPVLRGLKVGQSIREIGPKWHSSKDGTPTMGGIIFIIATAAGIAGMYFVRGSQVFNPQLLGLVICSLSFGAIGFIDDFIKVVLKRNLGLTERQKFLMQLAVALIYSAWMAAYAGTSISVPFTGFEINLGIFYIPLIVFVMVGVVNSVNLTDGLDGLAASVTIMVVLFFVVAAMAVGAKVAILNLVFEDSSFVYEKEWFAIKSILTFAPALAGALLGFLIFNKHPAKVFMGDTGSLFLGGAVASMAIMLGNPLILVIVGFVYVVETLSVILQVISFKLTGRRLFKMSPIHHHFEMIGWSEKKIVAVFSVVTVVMCIVGYFSIR